VKVLRIGLAAAAAAAVVAAAAVTARAADECRGLQVCLPVAGPWVVVPPAGQLPVEYELRCPLPAYVVAGVDARLADIGIDVSFRGETGSPVGPGVTTGNALLFTAFSTGPGPAPTSFRPFVGCVPASGGGGRALTAFTATRPGGLRPARLVERTVVTRRVPAGGAVVTVHCPRGLRLVGGAHAVAFRTAEPPPLRLLTAVRVVRSAAGNAVVARVTVAPGALGGARAEVQVQALCRKAAS
jgi:hypothetical protein